MGLQATPPVAGPLIKSNTLFYNDIGHAILAFNWVDQRVKRLIEKTQSRNSWVLVHAFPNDTYLKKLIAAMMIVENLKIVEET